MPNFEKRNRYLVKNTAIFAVGNLAPKIIAFFMVPIYTNVLNTSEYGIVDLINTISMIAIPFLILNISESIMRFSLDKGADYNKIMSVGLVIALLSVLIGFFFIPISRSFDGIKDYVWMIYFYTISLGLSQIFLSYLRGTERLIQFSIGNIIQTLAIGGLNVFFLCNLKLQIKGYFGAYILANLITCIYAFWIGNIKNVIRNFNIDTALAIRMIKYSFVLIPNTFMWWIINSSDRIMVTAMIGAATNGIYAISYKIPSMIQIFSNIFNQAWTYSAIRENESEDRDEYSNKVYYRITAMALMSGVGILAIIKPFLHYYVSAEYYIAWMYTPFLIIGYVFITMGAFLATTYTVNKNSKGFLFSSCCGAVINVILNFLLIPIFGINGAAISTGISYIAVFIYRVIDTRKYFKIDIFNKRHLMAIGILLLASVTIYINSILGQVLLIAETAVQFAIFTDIWKPIVKFIYKKEYK
ncbi:flippase [uncultured Acidaminococcus sp.]|uniref:flippase n=1 Tax=uncultured Acidaminococcus sp. TaxID=352152 RepID=UPI00263A06D9|nr:flippase [uncultured Acidaminococcus sp.]